MMATTVFSRQNHVQKPWAKMIENTLMVVQSFSGHQSKSILPPLLHPRSLDIYFRL